jgi:TRAP-type C4-dicarboxylate transport system permease small subunit
MRVLERAISVVCQVLLWVSTTVIFVILSVNTGLRYATGSSLQWANEVPELLFPWLVMAGVVRNMGRTSPPVFWSKSCLRTFARVWAWQVG